MAGIVVELWAARLPLIGWLAWHHWLVLHRAGAAERWEVWQRADAGGVSWGHLHRDLLPPERGVGGGPGWLIARWTGERAEGLAARIGAAPRRYPACRRYRFWPGPNSNTFVQWVLGSEHPLAWRGHGRGFARRLSVGAPGPGRRG